MGKRVKGAEMSEIITSIGLIIIYAGYSYMLHWSYKHRYEEKMKYLEEQIEELKSYIFIAK